MIEINPMPDLRMPDLIESISSGVVHAGNLTPENLRELEICRAWGLPLEVGDDDALNLVFDEDALIPRWITREVLPIAWGRCTIFGFLRIGSTNDEALRLARCNAGAGTIVFAEQQTAGRGRHRRVWISPPHAGLYFSLIVRPGRPLEHWPLLTHAASVALVRALQEASDPRAPRLKPEIKWPNDVLLSGRKTAGILLEVAMTPGTEPAAIIGVGINIRPQSVPHSLKAAATALDLELRQPAPRRKVMVSFLNSFQEIFQAFENGSYGAILEEWKAHSTMWNGVPIRVIEGETDFSGITRGLSDLGALRVRMDSGEERTVFAGDVSIRVM